MLLGCVVGTIAVLLYLPALFGPAWLGKAPAPPPPFALRESLTSFREVGFRLFVRSLVED